MKQNADEQRIAVLTEIIKEVEFTGDDYLCPWCYGCEYAGGHMDDCKRQVALYGKDWRKVIGMQK